MKKSNYKCCPIKFFPIWLIIIITAFILCDVSYGLSNKATGINGAKLNIAPTSEGMQLSAEAFSTIGYYVSRPMGLGLTGEYEWIETSSKRRSIVVNLGFRALEASDNIGYGLYGIEYLFHNGDYRNSWFWLYEGISLAMLNNRPHLSIPIGARFALKGIFNAYVELAPEVSSDKSLISFCFGIRTNELFWPFPIMPF